MIHAAIATNDIDAIRDFQSLQVEAQLALTVHTPRDRDELADRYVELALTLVDCGYGRHSAEWVALSRGFDVVANTLPAVSLVKPVSLAKRAVPNVDTALRSGLPVGLPVGQSAPAYAAPVCRDANGVEVRF